MNKYILIYCISLLGLSISAQDSIQETPKKQLDWHFSVGVDLGNPAMQLFTDKQEYSFLVNIQAYKKWFAQAQIGFTKNTFEDLGWISNIDGTFAKVGVNYIISQDREDKNNIFYVGGKFGFANYNQDLLQVPVRADDQDTYYTSFPSEKVTTYWAEIPFGARVSLYKNFYAEAILQTMIYMGSTSDSGIRPVVIPSFGRDRSGVNINVFWGIVYVIK